MEGIDPSGALGVVEGRAVPGSRLEMLLFCGRPC